jgi:CHAT domain-containing protein
MMHLMEQGVSRDKNGKAQFAFAHPMFWAPFSLIGDGR